MQQSSSGDIGTLNIQGRQIGGFLNWEIKTVISQVNRNTVKAAKLSSWKARASCFWLLESMPGGEVEAVFYCYNGRELRQVSRNMVRVNLPGEYPLNKKVHGLLVMTHG